MTVKIVIAAVAATLLFSAPGRAPLSASGHPSLAGRWTLNRQLSQFPGDLGFGMDLLAGAGSRSGSGGGAGGRTRGGGGALPAAAWFQESQDDAKRRDQLVEEVRDPSAQLTITESEDAITFAGDHGHSRTFHPDGKEESHELDGVGVATITRWEGDRLEIRYKVEQYRELRYTYSRTFDPPRLTVEVRFVESGGHEVVTRVYEPARADEPAPPAPGRSSATPPPPPAPAPPSAAPALPGAAPPASPAPAAAPVLQGPDADLKGLTQIGVVVEDLSPQAAACGLNQGTIETAVSKSLTDAGFAVRRNSDEDTYFYVNIMTSRTSSGLCASRYDAFLYTHTTTTLPYQTKPVLAQVVLLHRGGIAGGNPAAHAQTVMKDVKEYADEFARRIRDVNPRQ